MYGFKDVNKPLKFLFQIGDHVRLSISKRLFEKGYTNNWTKEIFVIHQQVINEYPTYVIKDLNDEIILGKFYENELQKVIINKEKRYEIDQILKTRKVNKKKNTL